MEAANRLAQVTAERDFLLLRSRKAGSCSLSNDERWTGMSSNALVEVAFGGRNDCLPSDGSDLAACYRTIQRLPDHLLTKRVFQQLRRGEKAVRKWSPTGVAWAKKVTGWNLAEAEQRAASGMSAGTAETRSGSGPQDRQPDPKGDAQSQPPYPQDQTP